MKRSLLWFRNDLRTHDHIPLTNALDSDSLLPVFCIDPARLTPQSPLGFPRLGNIRAQFLLETLQDLNKKLNQLDSALHIAVGDPVRLIPGLVAKYEITDLYHQAEPAFEERKTRNTIKEKLEDSVQIHSSWGSTLFQLTDLPFKPTAVPDVYTQFRKKCEKYSHIHEPLPSPQRLPPLPDNFNPEANSSFPSLSDLNLPKPDIDTRTVYPFKGGEQAGIKRVREYLWEEDHLKNYKKTRNGMLGANYSSKFSPWLAVGALSPRYIHNEVKRYEQERVSNQSTYWMIFELIWRDYWKFLFIKYDPEIFYPGGLQSKSIEWSHDIKLFNTWKNGKTGFPFVDANMRELKRTGFMSNRGRQNVASFLTKNLGIDWRWGAAWFESQLIDYDVYSNYGNWGYVSGVGTDPRDRYFHIVTQAKKYDNDGKYVKYWLEELSDVPGKLMPEFHKQHPEELKMYNVVLGETYPEPVIDLEVSYEKLRQK